MKDFEKEKENWKQGIEKKENEDGKEKKRKRKSEIKKGGW